MIGETEEALSVHCRYVSEVYHLPNL